MAFEFRMVLMINIICWTKHHCSGDVMFSLRYELSCYTLCSNNSVFMVRNARKYTSTPPYFPMLPFLSWKTTLPHSQWIKMSVSLQKKISIIRNCLHYTLYIETPNFATLQIFSALTYPNIITTYSVGSNHITTNIICWHFQHRWLLFPQKHFCCMWPLFHYSLLYTSPDILYPSFS